MNYKGFKIFEKKIFGYNFLLSNTIGFGNFCIISRGIERWYHSVQIPPYTSVRYDEYTNSVEVQTSYYTEKFEWKLYNEAFFYGKIFQNYYKKVEKNAIWINSAINNAEILFCKIVDGKVIEPMFTTADSEGKQFIGTFDECYMKDRMEKCGFSNVNPVELVKRVQFVETDCLCKAETECPWADEILKTVDGGYLCYEYTSDYKANRS